MKLSKILHSLTEKDPKIVEIPDFVISGKPSDENHAQRLLISTVYWDFKLAN